jgi:hypothetical protein
MKVVEEHTLGGSLERAPLFHISVLVQSAVLDYTSQIDAAPVSSSRILFLQSQMHK